MTTTTEPLATTVDYFESVYAEAAGDASRIPWASRQPSQALVNWLNAVAPGLIRCGARVAIAGCGLGADAREVIRRGYEVTAFDCSQTAVGWARQLDPDHADAHYNLGRLTTSQGRVEEAITHHSQAVRANPDHAEAHYNLGLLFGSVGRVEEAIGHYSRAIEIEPYYVEAHNNLGVALGKQGKFEKAIGHLSKALQIKPDNVEANTNLGMAYIMQKKLDKAIYHCSTALEIKPDCCGLSHNLV